MTDQPYPTGWEPVRTPSNVPWDELDPGIVWAVHALADYGIDTFASCQGGHGHEGYGGMPVILFHGDDHAGLWAVWLLELQGFRVQTLSRHWNIDHWRPRQPSWQVSLLSLTPRPPGDGTRNMRQVADAG